MATKLEKAQLQYERILRELGSRAEMVEQLEKADPAIRKKYIRAKEALEDRKLELEFIVSEIDNLLGGHGKKREQLKEEIDELKSAIDKKDKVINTRKSKSGPIHTQLAGAEYDIRFVEKAMKEEVAKAKDLREREAFEKAKVHEANIKRIKIDILKRKKSIRQMRKELKEIEGPMKKQEEEVEQMKAKVEEIQEQYDAMEEGSDLTSELERQREEKEKEIERCELHKKDVLADLGENLYEKRAKHPVLSKYYQDLDQVAAVIDSLQGKE
ncbi:MAG: hypothetical protein JXR96_02395 [Deltaproteobacteria bacterium]|nr:hypothetical protein [Deltaproteobacteria bacterium]